MKLRRSLPALVLALLAAAPAWADRPARVALLAPLTPDAARTVQELTQTQLGDEKGVTLLDRATIDRLLQEQKLALSGRVDADTAARAGKILAVDLLGVVEVSVAAKQALGITVFDAATGVRLADLGFTALDAAQQAREAAAGVRSAVAKWRAGPKNLKTVCFLPVRNADLPRHLDPFCEGIAASLERQLLSSPVVTTLERKRLVGVTKERAVAEAAATRELLASLLLIETEIGRAGRGVRATVTVRDNAGTVRHRITQQVADPNGAGLLGPLAERVHAALKTAAGAGQGEREREGRRFRREAEDLWKHDLYEPALRAAEAAFALHPDDDARLLLAEYLVRVARERWKPGINAAKSYSWTAFTATPDQVRDALSLARRSLYLVDLARPTLRSRPEHGGYWSLAENGSVFHSHGEFTHDIHTLTIDPPDDAAAEDLMAFRRDGIRRTLDTVRELADRAGPRRAGFEVLTRGVCDHHPARLQHLAPDASTVMAGVLEVLSVWNDASLEFSADAFPLYYTNMVGERMMRVLLQPDYKVGEYTPADRERSLALLKAMQEHPHPAFRLYAEYYQTRQLQKLGKIDDAEAVRRNRKTMEAAKDWIDRAPFKQPAAHRTALYQVIDYVLSSNGIPDKAERIETYFDLAEYMLRRGDVEAMTWVHAANNAMHEKQQQARALDLIRRMQAAYAAPKHRHFHDPTKLVPRELERTAFFIRKFSPALNKEPTALPWDRVTKVVGLTDVKHARRLMAPTRLGSQVYVVAGCADPAQPDRPYLQLVRASLNGAAPAALGRVHVTPKNYNPKDVEHAFWGNESFLSGCVIHDGVLYAGTRSAGVFAFPLSGGDGRPIGEREGLPALDVIALTAVDHHLLVSLEGGYLVAYDLAAGRADVIASSRRTQAQSPFDNGKPFRTRGLTADPARHRVLFSLFQETKSPNNGTWEYDVRARRFKKLLPTYWYDASQVTGGTVYFALPEWHGKNDWLGRYDLAADRFTLLHGKSPQGLEDDPPTPAGLPPELSLTFPDRIYHRGYVWTRHYFGRRPIGSDQFTQLPHVGTGIWSDVTMGEALEAVSEVELLIANWRDVYLVQLKGE